MFITRLLSRSRHCEAFTSSTGRIGHRINAGTLSNIRIYHQGPIYGTKNDQPTGNGPEKKRKNKKMKVPKKIKVNPNTSGNEEELLAAAFAKMAREEGFDDSTAFYADDSTFEEDFDNDEINVKTNESFEADKVLDNNDMDVGVFDDDMDVGVFDDDIIDFGSGNMEDDMDRRLAEATRGDRITIPDELDELSQNEISLRKLGFEPEVNPFGDDETIRKDEFRLVTNAITCSACGSDFQCNSESRPGFLPSEKFDIQIKLGKIEELQNLKMKAEKNTEWNAEDEIEYLIHGEDHSNEDGKLVDLNIDAVAEEMGLDLAKLSEKKIICKRCHGLQNSGKVEESLRPGWTEEPLMSQSIFRSLLKPLRDKPAVIIALVDLFDFAGSVLTELDSIAGENPVLLAANKADLLPSKMGQHRAENWVRRELEYLGVQSIANVGGAVRLVSCKTGFGVSGLLSKARQLAEEMDADVYVVGAANAGKSTLVNHILKRNSEKEPAWRKKKAGNANANKGAVTVSPLPGTTLKFIKVDLGDKRSLYDTPGLLVPGTLTQLLTPEELKIVVPKKKVEPITFRVASGKCVLVGGLARVGVIGDSKPFLLTFFVANDIKLHPTTSDKADSLIEKQSGKMLTPPLEKRDIEWEHHDVEIDGSGWKEACADITLCGLGWVAVTGAGKASVRVTVPKGIGVAVRPPLMPYDVWEVASRYTGGKATRKVSKKKYGSKRKGVGRN